MSTQSIDNILDINGIPAFITQEHNENFRYWMQLKDSLLLHIDAHSDMGSPFVNGIETPEIDFYKNLSIADFICPALYYGFVSEIYWLNPHLNEEKRLVRYDCKAKLEGVWISWDRNPMEEPVECIEEIHKLKPMILDVDLDAFCCSGLVHGVRASYDAIGGWEERVCQAADFIRRLKKPDVITITRSQGTYTYVPKLLVDSVQDYTLGILSQLYKSRGNGT